MGSGLGMPAAMKLGMNARHSFRIALAAAENALGGLAPHLAPRNNAARDSKYLELAPGLTVQYCLNTDDRAWNSGEGNTGPRLGQGSFVDRKPLKGARYDVLWMAPMITGVVLLWVRLGLAASGLWPMF